MPSVFPAVLIVTLFATAASARTWNVYADGSGDAPTIQAAADSSAPGDSLLIGPGIYGEAIMLPHDLTLKGTAGSSATSVSAGGVRSSCVRSASAVTRLVLEGLTFEATSLDEYGECRAEAVTVRGDVEVRDCRFRLNEGYGQGSALVAFGNLTVVDSEFSGNWAYTKGGYCSQYPDAGCGVSCISVFGTLDLEGCLFEENSCHLIAASGARVGGNVFRLNQSGAYWGDEGLFRSYPDLLEGNLFVENSGALFEGYDCRNQSAPSLRIVTNTFARNPDFFADCPVPDGCRVERNVFTGSRVGIAIPGPSSNVYMVCNNSWGNTVNYGGVNVVGVLGNISEPPLYCAPGFEDFTVAANSPLLPANNFCAAQIGAFGQGCQPVAIESVSWGRIKAGYRTRR